MERQVSLKQYAILLRMGHIYETAHEKFASPLQRSFMRAGSVTITSVENGIQSRLLHSNFTNALGKGINPHVAYHELNSTAISAISPWVARHLCKENSLGVDLDVSHSKSLLTNETTAIALLRIVIVTLYLKCIEFQNPNGSYIPLCAYTMNRKRLKQMYFIITFK